MADDDRSAIIEVLNMYALALDAHRWDLFDRVFTQDVHAEFGPASAAWTDLESFKRGFEVFHATLDSHQHTMMGQLVRIDGDEAHAFSYGNWLLIRQAAEGGPTWSGTGWYDDVLVRTEQGWRIRRRICRLQGWSGNPGVPLAVAGQSPDMKLNSLHVAAEAGDVAFLDAISVPTSSR
jgi:3-phenylpropionate/cinnamic acid dioxygenase small subunit